jgi:CSLREA domain-containing protein
MRRFTRLTLSVLLLCSFLLSPALAVRPAYAAGIIVNTNADNTIADGFCTLREAITNANNDAATYSDCTAGSGNDTITFAANYTITLSSALPDITDTDGLTITGNGSANTIVQAAASAGSATYRIIKINGASSSVSATLEAMTFRYGGDTSGAGINNQAGTLTLNNMIVSNNQIPSTSGLNGGAISQNGGTTTINNSIISNNSIGSASATTNGNGGGIFVNTGTLTINNTTISGNSAYNNGGGVYIKASGSSITINNSTISGNTASNTSETTGGGGGIAQTAGTFSLNNVTISGNSAVSNGAGLFMSAGTMNVSYSTIANNNADSNSDATGDGGGAYSSGGTLNLKSSIVAGNKKASSTDNDCSGTITSQGYNMTGSSTGCSLAGTGDVTVTPSTVFTSVLGALSDNGGSTYTHFLYGGNAAKDAIPNGTNSCGSGTFATDQIGSTRPYNSNCDIGAYESQDAAPTVSMSSTAGNPTSTSPILVTVTFNESVTGFTAGDITAGNATISNFAGSGASYSFDLTPSSDGTVTADIAAGVAQDSVYNYNTAATQFSRTYDGTGPTVTSFTATSPTNSLNIPITAFTASDSAGVTGYMITTSSTPPSAGAAGWAGTAPSSYTVASAGAYTLYPWAKDALGNVSAVFGSPRSVTVDTTPPTVTSITRDTGSPNPSNASSVTFLVGFSETITGVDTSDFALTITGSISGASVTNVSQFAAILWTVTVNTGSGDGAIRLDLADDDSISDAAGNKLGGTGTGNGSFTSGQTFTIDRTSPAVAMSSSASDPTNATIPVTVTFSESVSGFTSGDITPGNGAVSNFAGSGTTYTFDLTPSTDGSVTATIAAGVASDATGNGNTAATQFSRVYDSTAPSVTSFTVTSPSSHLNIPITAFAASDAVGVSGYLITESATPPSAGAAGWTASAPTSYSVPGDGTYTLYPWAKDAAGNVSAVYGSPVSATVETTAPSVVSSLRANANPTRASSVDFIVTFSEAVSGVDTSDFSLTTSGVTGTFITGVSGSGATRTISVNTGSGSGTIRLDLHDDDSITDSASNPLDGNFLSGDLYTIDKTAPTAGSLVAANVTTGGGTTYSFTVTFSDNLAIDVTSLDESDIRVTGSGGFNQLATLVSVTPAGNGTPRTATYQITAPGGAWDSLDGGSYTIAVEANQVFDSAGNGVGATSMGSFQVSLKYTTYLPLVQ